VDIGILTFELSGRRFAIELGFVREVLALGNVTPVPGAPAAVRGLINVRGMLAAALDLAVLCGDRPHASRPGDAVVLLEAPPQPWSEGQPPRVAIPVDRVLEVSPSPPEIEPTPAAPDGPACVRALLALESGPAALLDVPALIASVRALVERAAS